MCFESLQQLNYFVFGLGVMTVPPASLLSGGF